MPTITVPIQGVERDALPQLEYALTFASEDIVAARIVDETTIEADVRTAEACDSATAKIRELIDRYAHPEFGLPQEVHFEQARDLPRIDAWQGLLERRLVTPVGKGQVILRGLAARLMSAIDRKVEREFSQHFGAELEIYPSTIESRTLDRCAHFTSFPEHIDFVAHLKEDLDVLNGFVAGCREGGWSSGLHDGRMVWYGLGEQALGGQGITSEAVRQLTHYAFSKRGLQSLYAWTMRPRSRAFDRLYRTVFA